MSALPDFMFSTPARPNAPIEAAPPLPPTDQPAPDAEARRVMPWPGDGVYEGMPAQDYFDVEAMSQSGAKKILRSPAHYKLDRTKQAAPTDAMQLGSGIHDATLEPDDLTKRVVQAPEVNTRTNAGKAELEAFRKEHAGKIILSPDDYARMIGARNAVRRHARAMRLIEAAAVESSLFWHDARFKVKCKARLDLRSFGGLVDLKSTRDASPEEFARSCATFGYHIQAANYFSGHEHALGGTPDFFAIIAVETDPPHGVGLYTMPADAIMAGARLMDRALELYAEALETGIWKGYDEAVVQLKFPKWALRFDL